MEAKNKERILVPSRDRQATLVDLLDRVLEKGIVIKADVVITLAGVPLIAINLRATLAGMEAMLKYGLMKELDERIRSSARREAKALSKAR